MRIPPQFWPTLDLNLGTLVGGGGPVIWPGGRQLHQPHLYVCGTTGMGKSRELEHIVCEHCRTWHRHRCPLVMLDLHGSMYRNVLTWLARSRVTHLPIIPVDFQRDDFVLAYNPMRHRRGFDPSVPITGFVRAMSFIFDTPNTNGTPRLERWSHAVFHGVYAIGRSLYAARHLLNESAAAKPLRIAVAQALGNHPTAAHWQMAADMAPGDFGELTESLQNRFQRFVDSEAMRLMFGSVESSLDLEELMEEGGILLVNLATQGGKLRSEDAALFGTMLIADLWDTAALRSKGKGDCKPCRVIVDEFQNFISPALARGLAEARGFRLWLTMANQFPRQLLHAGASGEAVFDNVMVNAPAKIVFRLPASPRYSQELVEDMFGGTIDPMLIKRMDYSTKVVGQREETRTVVSRGDSEGLREGSGGACNRSWGKSSTEGVMPVFLPEFEREVSGVQFYPLSEQLHNCMRVLADQRERECVIRLPGMQSPLRVFTPEVPDVVWPEEAVNEYVTALMRKRRFFLPRAQALKSLELEDEAIRRLAHPRSSEPTSARGAAATRKV